MSNILSAKPDNAQSIVLTDAQIADMDEVADAMVAAARAAGAVAGQLSAERAEDECPGFGERALTFIVDHVRQKGRVSGESVTLSAVKAGIKPPDQRAFGPIYAKALRKGLIHVAGYVPRVRGHGSAGGKLYAPGPDPKALID
ncbi:hypothetical protein D3C87_1679570 [compost metagenome]